MSSLSIEARQIRKSARNLHARVKNSSERKNSSNVQTHEENLKQTYKLETVKKEHKSELEIVDVKQSPLTDDDIKSIVDIEVNPKVREWVYEPFNPEYQIELRDYQLFFKKLPKNKNADVLVAKNDGKVIGFLALWKVGAYMEHVATIGISIEPNFWGKGVATQLITSAIELAKRRGIKRLEVETLSENTPMRRVVEKLGFKLESIRKDRVNKNGSYHDEVAYFMLL